MEYTSYTKRVLIIGAGFSGLFLAHRLLDQGCRDFLVVAPDRKTASDKSYFNLRSRGVKQLSLKESIIETGKRKNNRQLVNVLVQNIDDELTYLSKLTTLKPSFIGVAVSEPSKFLTTLRGEINGNRIFQEIADIEKVKGKGFIACTEGGVRVACERVVFCTGGLRGRVSPNFHNERLEHDAFKIAHSLGCAIEYGDLFMVHPFYSKGVCIPTDHLAEYLVFDRDGNPIDRVNQLLEAHNAHHCFDEIASLFEKYGPCVAKKGEVEIQLNPAPHYRLGGIRINKYGQTTIKDVYALGECSFGAHGLGRIGGCALSEILVMSRVISKRLIC